MKKFIPPVGAVEDEDMVVGAPRKLMEYIQKEGKKARKTKEAKAALKKAEELADEIFASMSVEELLCTDDETEEALAEMEVVEEGF